jgi:hypothetical protein
MTIHQCATADQFAGIAMHTLFARYLAPSGEIGQTPTFAG